LSGLRIEDKARILGVRAGNPVSSCAFGVSVCRSQSKKYTYPGQQSNYKALRIDGLHFVLLFDFSGFIYACSSAPYPDFIGVLGFCNRENPIGKREMLPKICSKMAKKYSCNTGKISV